MVIEENEMAVLRRLIKSGVTKDVSSFSIRKQLGGVKLKAFRVVRKEVLKTYTTHNAMTLHKWVKQLAERGLVVVDNTHHRSPTIRLTDEGEALCKD